MIVAIIKNDINRMFKDVEEVFENELLEPFKSEEKVNYLINSLVSLYPFCFNKRDMKKLFVDTDKFYSECERRFKHDINTMKIIECSKKNRIYYSKFDEDDSFEIRFLEVI